MILRKLKVVNFKSLQDETIVFKEGVTLIRGLNESGKSTIMEAILYALYGLVLRPKSNAGMDKLIEFNSERALIKLTFEIDKKTYQVTREIFKSKRKTSKARIVQIHSNGKHQEIGVQSVNEVTKTVKALLGNISYHEIVSSSIVAQKELGKLVRLQRGDRKKIINVFLNLEHFNKITNKIKDRRRDLLGKREEGNGRIDSEQEKLDRLNETREAFNDNSEDLHKKSESLSKKEREIDSTEKTLQTTEALLNKLEEYNKKWLMKQKLDQSIRSLQDQKKIRKKQLDDLNSLEEERESLSQRVLELEYVEQAEEVVADIQTAIREFEDLGQSRDTLQESSEKQQRSIAAQREQTTKVKPTQKELEILSSSISLRMLVPLILAAALLSALGVTVSWLFFLGAVPVVLFMILTTYKYLQRVSLMEKRSNYLREDDKLKALKDSLDQTTRRIEDIQSDMEQLLYSIESYVDQLPPEIVSGWEPGNVDSGHSVIERFEQERDSRSNLVRDIEGINKRLEEKPEIMGIIADLEQEVVSKREELDSVILPALPDGIEFSEKVLEDTREEEKNLREEKVKLITEIAILEKRIVELEEFLEENKGIHERCEAQEKIVADLREEERISRIVLEALEATSKNLRERVLPNVERYMQRILPVITSNRYKAVRLKEDYKLEIWNEDAGEFQEKEMFSGGTEDQFLLAMRIAFALSLLPLRKHAKPEFLFLDEPLGSSDVVRREGIMNLTQDVLKESFKQIIIISHVEGLEDYIDHVLEVVDGKITAI